MVRVRGKQEPPSCREPLPEGTDGLRGVTKPTGGLSVRRPPASCVLLTCAADDVIAFEGTGDVCLELVKIYGDDKIVFRPRAGKLGLGTA